MKNLKRLGATVALTLVFGLSALAGDIQTPPCAAPQPGIIESPPCAGGQVAPDPVVPGQMDAPPTSFAADASAFALGLFESLLPIF